MQEKQTINYGEFADLDRLPKNGRLVSIDPGTKRIGVALSDENRIVCSTLPLIERSSWKKLLANIQAILQEFDAKALIIGLPLESDGSESPMSSYSRELARKFKLSLDVPVFLQDERVSSYEARSRLWNSEGSTKQTLDAVDSEAAAVILGDFIDRIENRLV